MLISFTNRCLVLSLTGLALVALLFSGCLGRGSGTSPVASSEDEALGRPGWQLIYTDVDFADPSLGLISGWRGVMLRSIDAGTTWTQTKVNSKTDLNSVAILDANTAVAVGSGGNILRSTDSGQTWSPVESPTREILNAVVPVGPGVAVAAGWHGTILRTQDNGKTWSRQPGAGDPSLDFESIDFTTHGVGIVVSSSGRAFKSSDGALTWQPIPMPHEGMKFYGVSLLNDKDAFLSGNVEAEQTYAFGGKSVLIRTGDGGASWTLGPREINTDFLAIKYLMPGNAVAAGWGGQMWYTMDDGASWQKLLSNTTRALRSIAKVDRTTIVAVGDGQTIIVSRDGAATWNKVSGS
ncbi:MAG: WD40/YVTN/BNR-like repeat-containing protein [Thermoleophilia bacterium]